MFHRQAPVAPAYSYDPYAQSQHSQHSHQSYAPPAPNSLAPVEMNAYSAQHPQARNYPTDRGVAHTSTNNIRPRPSWRTGAMILLAGVFVGGTFGIGVQARRNAMDEQANIAAAAANLTPPPAQTLAAAAPGPTALQLQPPQAPPQAYAQAPANAGLPPGAIVLPPQQGVVVVPAQGQPQPQPQPQPHPQAQGNQAAPPSAGAVAQNTAPAVKPQRPVWHAPPPPVRPTGPTIAAKVTAPPVTKKDPPPKADPPADPPEKAEKPTKGSKKGSSDAQKLLQDAIGETTNTL